MIFPPKTFHLIEKLVKLVHKWLGLTNVHLKNNFSYFFLDFHQLYLGVEIVIDFHRSYLGGEIIIDFY